MSYEKFGNITLKERIASQEVMRFSFAIGAYSSFRHFFLKNNAQFILCYQRKIVLLHITYLKR